VFKVFPNPWHFNNVYKPVIKRTFWSWIEYYIKNMFETNPKNLFGNDFDKFVSSINIEKSILKLKIR